MVSHAINLAVTILFSLYIKWGSWDYIGEAVTQIEHAIQAAMAAEADGASPEMILGALFHDIGHLLALDRPEGTNDLDGLGAVKHEDIGADFLMNMGFPELVSAGARLHVKAKRYMLTVNPDYRQKMSAASLQTFILQGGEMSPSELAQFRAQPFYKKALQYRVWDDQAKVSGMCVHPLSYYHGITAAVLERHYAKITSDSNFETDGYSVIRNFFSPRQQKLLIELTGQLESTPNVKGKWMKYYESNNQNQLARIENLLDYFPQLAAIVNSPRVLYLVEQLLAEPAVLFKEKLNLKYPGGGAFGAHQDEPAFSMFPHGYHITVCIPVDNMTIDNGCLEIVKGSHTNGILPQNPDRTLAKEYEADAAWEPVELQTGDILLFGSYLAHRSSSNRSDASRRAYYLTFNALSKGNDRKEYYIRKRRSLPPDNERRAGTEYPFDPAFNVGNPIKCFFRKSTAKRAPVKN